MEEKIRPAPQMAPQLLFVLFDLKAQFAEKVFQSRTIIDAQRMIAEVANDERSLISRYPEDYALYQVGTFNQETLAIEATVPIVSCGKAIDFVRGQ